MNKKVLLSAAVAVMLVAALAVTAFAASSISGPGSVEQGETITITVSTDANGFSGNVSTSGLEVISGTGGMSNASSVIILADMGGNTATYTCRVTGEPGSTVSFSLSNCKESDGQSDTDVTVAPWSATVAGGSEPSQEPTQRPTQEPSQEPTQVPTSSVEPTASGTATSTASGAPGASVSPSAGTSAKPSSGTQDKMPKTGDATMDLWTLVIIAAACGAVAIVAGKKVLSR